MQTLVVLSTCPDSTTAENLARLLVEQQLAACINILPGMISIYPWQGAIQHAEECGLIIKTDEAHYPALEALLREHHPYEIPEIIALPVAHGAADYLGWVRSCLRA